MSQAKKMLAKMRRSPQADWSIADVETICNAYDVDCEKPSRGSHYKISHATQVEILTVPARKPIKATYITDLVEFIDAVEIAATAAELAKAVQEEPRSNGR